MKKFLLQIVLFCFVAIHAQDSQGVNATIELISGTKKNVQFLGIQDSAANIGGTINGQFTVIRIPLSRIKSMVDSSGTDLLSPPAASVTANDTADTVAIPAADSATIEVADSAISESPFAPAPPKVASFLDSVESRHIFVALERRSSDSVLAHQLDNLLSRLLKESGTPITYVKRSNFGNCQEAACIRDSLIQHGAASAYLGRIIAAKAPDSVTIQASHYDFSDSTHPTATASSQINLSAIRSISDALNQNKLSNFVAALQGEAPVAVKKGKSYIHVETDPEGANITLWGQTDLCKSPCTFLAPDSNKTVIYAYWGVGQQLWGARASVVPAPADTVKISLKLKRVTPELQIRTIPEGAEIYAGSAPLTQKAKPLGKTPDKYPIYEPGFSTVQFRKEGFRDTLVTVFAPPTEVTNINVELTPITNLQEQITQQEWLRERKKSFIGKTLMGSSIAPLLVGALFTYLASVDYNDADKIKNHLSLPAAGGENYQRQVKKNRDLVHSGDKKMIIGGTLLGTGALLLGVGFALSF